MPGIRAAVRSDVGAIHDIINDAAQAYKGVIPADRWHEPYMPLPELESEIARGIRFYCATDGDRVIGVMGIQDVKDVTLIRHAYVRTAARRHGIGQALLQHLNQLTQRPVLIGTWKAATWAIRFYEKNGFRLVSDAEKNQLLRTYWTIPDRQVEESVVLVNSQWRGAVTIREIAAATFDEPALLDLLRDAVDAGASVGYLVPLADADGRAFWQGVKAALADGRVLFGAYVGDRLVGSVQLDPVGKPNGRHRAEVQKLLVLREFRGRGIAKALMAAVERKAAGLGRWLLVLDTVPGQPAEKLYERLGYRRAGVVPDYAEKSGGGFEPTVIFYKKLE
jgi:GNAT superfamily N-acetyltransferase